MSKTQAIMWAPIPHGSGIATAKPELMAPLAAANVNGGEQALLLVANQVASGGGGNPVSLLGLADNADNVAPIGAFIELYQGAVVRLTGYDGGADNWDRIRSVADTSDAQVTGIGHLATCAEVFAFNGATYDRCRTNSAAVLAGTTQPFAQEVAEPGEWAVNSEPAVTTQATATKAAGGVGVRHVCRSLHFSLAAVAAQTIISARVRDGASGAGTILWSQQVIAPAGSAVHIELAGLNIVGSAATAMTFEWSGAPVATNFETAGGTGYSTI